MPYISFREFLQHLPTQTTTEKEIARVKIPLPEFCPSRDAWTYTKYVRGLILSLSKMIRTGTFTILQRNRNIMECVLIICFVTILFIAISHSL